MPRGRGRRRGRRGSASKVAAKVPAEDDSAKGEGGEAAAETTNPVKGTAVEEEASEVQSKAPDDAAAEEGAAAESAEPDPLMEKDADELAALLEEIQGKLSQVEAQAQSDLERVADEAAASEVDSQKGISLLEVKTQVLLAYCVRICFYLLLKLTGEGVEGSEVVDQQAQLRVLLDKLGPIDKKIKYQVSQLLRAAAMESEGGGDSGTAGDKALGFRPNPAALVADAAPEGGDDDGAGAAPKGTYRPPQVAPMTMTESKESRKRAKQKRRMANKAAQNSVIRNMRAMVSDAPEETGTGGGAVNTSAKFESERNAFEEDNFVRLNESKKDRATRKRREREAASIHSVADFDDFTDIIKMTDKGGRGGDEGSAELAALRREKALQAALQKGGNKKRKANSDATGSVPPPAKKTRTRRKRAGRR